MADQKERQDRPQHGHDPHGKDDPGRTHPYQFNEPRSKEEIVAQAYDHEDPTPTQEENDQAKLDSVFQPPGSGDPQAAKKKQMEAQQSGGYQTRAATANPNPIPQPPKPAS